MFSSAFFLILLTCALYGIVHSILASHTVKAWAARHMGGTVYRRYYRLFFVIMAVVTVLPPLAMVALLPDKPIYAIPAPWVYLTLLVQGIALVGILIGLMQTGVFRFLGLEQLTHPDSVPPQPEKLVMHGLYRWVRHPLYTFSFLLLWLVPAMSWNILALNLGFSAYLLIGTFFEERKLVKQFGETYLAYRLRTPRIVPGLKIGKL